MGYKKKMSPGIKKQAYRKTKGTCFYCGIALNNKNRTLDHIIPYSRSNDSSVCNLIPACKKCNTEKGRKTLSEWHPVQGLRKTSKWNLD